MNGLDSPEVKESRAKQSGDTISSLVVLIDFIFTQDLTSDEIIRPSSPEKLHPHPPHPSQTPVP